MEVISMETLLERCEKLAYADRMKTMYEIGLQSRTAVSTRDLVSKLLQGSLYEQILGLQTCYGSRDITIALQGVVSQSRSLRTLSMIIISRIGSNEDILEMMASIQSHLRAKALHVLRRQRRQQPLDAFLEQLATDDPDDELLRNQISLGSEELVEKWLPVIVERFNPEHWARLSRRYPAIVCRQIRIWVSSEGKFTPDMYPVLDVVLPQMGGSIMARSVADMALNLVELLQKYIPLSALRLQPLLNKRPQRVAELILREGKETSLVFSTVSHELQCRELCLLFEKYPKSVSQHSFDKFSPEQRLAVYHLSRDGWKDRNGILSPSIVGKLPAAERVLEAQRQLKLPHFEVLPVQRIPYISFLPWKEAMILQTPWLRSGDADTRASALSYQIAAACYDEAHLDDALQLLIQRRFEQDPVRQVMLRALAQLPPSRWKPEHFPALASIVRDSLDASDMSSSGSLVKLLGNMIPFHPSWATSQVLIVLRERGERYESTNRLFIGRYTKHIASIVADNFLPYIKTLQKQENDRVLINVASAFGKNIRFFPKLLIALEESVLCSKIPGSVSKALCILAEHSPHRLQILMPKLLAADPSFMRIDEVKHYIHRHQQYLITPYLNQKEYEGRFTTGKSRVPLDIDGGFYRWTQIQQNIYAKALLEDLNDEDHPVGELQMSIINLAALYFVDPAFLISFANDKRIIVRDATLRALRKLDAGQGIPSMLEALGDTRARIVIYSLPSVLKAMSKTEAFQLLQSTPTDKVTVAKEVLRLIGDLGTEDAYQYLLKKSETEMHPDIHIALLRALWSYLNRTETWLVYRQAAQLENPDIPHALTAIPTNGMSQSARKEYVAIHLLLLSHPQPPVRLSALHVAPHLPREDSEQELVSLLLKLLKSSLRDEASAASCALFTRYRDTQPRLIGEAFQSLTDRAALVTAFEPYILNVAALDRDKMLASTYAILAALRTDPLSLPLRLRLIFVALPWKNLKEEMLALAPELHADGVVQAEGLIAGLRWRPDVELKELEGLLAGRKEENMRRLGLAVVVVQSKFPTGWTSHLRERLSAYQRDKSVLVAGAAVWIFPTLKLPEDVSSAWEMEE